MFGKSRDVTIHTYVHVAADTRIRIVRHEEEDGDDIISVRFGDEDCVLELDDGVVPRLVRALKDGRRPQRSGDLDGEAFQAPQDQVVAVGRRSGGQGEVALDEP